MIEQGYALADPDFYAPLESVVARGEVYRPSQPSTGWAPVERGLWTFWRHRDVHTPERGWKVHVSARPDRVATVLDRAARICFGHGVAFKHLSCQLAFQWVHHKHSARPQSGKLIAAYPEDVAAARRLMEALRAELADEEGPYILTDRRYRDSRTVHYRYGAFTEGRRMTVDGTYEHLVTDGTGQLVDDRRGVSFRLPNGIVDPFVDEQESAADTVTFHGFRFEAALRHSNGGGTYRGVEEATGRRVFIKEARDHTGLTWDDRTAPMRQRAEWDVLTVLRDAAPGIAPKPVSYFREWEHEFMVTEFVAGTTLKSWTVRNNPLIQPLATADDFQGYYARCSRIISALESIVDTLHRCGYAFVDLSPGNVLIDDEDHVRLVDFEAAHRIGSDFRPIGTDGYVPPGEFRTADPADFDRYALSAMTQLLLAPMHNIVQRNPNALDHLRHEIDRVCPLPDDLWRRVTRFHRPGGTSQLPTPEQLAADPVGWLADLRDRTAAALLAMSDLDHPDRVFPTVPQGYLTNPLCVAYGTAGVVHALRHAGYELPAGVLDRLRREALDAAELLPPGLHTGSAGIAWVLADCGLLDEASTLLAAADEHELTGRRATLADGDAGLAMAHLALFSHTGDERHVDHALRLAEAIPTGADLVARLGPDNATGLLHGRTGIALMWQQLAHSIGDERGLQTGLRLLHEELDRASDPDAPSLGFPVSSTDRRSMPYLYCGSAGVLRVVTRYVTMLDDERMNTAVPRLLLRVCGRYTAMSGLYQGLAGLGLTLTEHAAVTGDDRDRAAALRCGQALVKYAVPHATGARFLGDRLLRFSADLWSGSAGVLLFLNQLLDPRPDPLFTLDRVEAGRHDATSIRAVPAPTPAR